MKRFLRHLTRIACQLGRAVHRQSDYSRWSDTENLREEWDERTKALAQFIQPGSRVFELGAGRCRLRNFLPDKCTYMPSDIVQREADTFICDLNKRPLPGLDSFAPDIIVMSGVFEYVNKPVEIFRWLGEQTREIAMSYICVASDLSGKKRIVVWAERSLHGWVNHFDEQELLALFATAGFSCQERATWGVQSLFKLSRTTPAA